MMAADRKGPLRLQENLKKYIDTISLISYHAYRYEKIISL